MSSADLLYPVFVQIALTFVLLFWMGYARVRAVNSRGVRISDIALRQPAWPEHVLKIGNCFHNQLETPILFYVLIGFVILTNKVGTTLVILAWAYVLCRIVHAAIQTTTNRVFYRFYVYAIGSLILLAMWVIFALRILTEGV